MRNMKIRVVMVGFVNEILCFILEQIVKMPENLFWTFIQAHDTLLILPENVL